MLTREELTKIDTTSKVAKLRMEIEKFLNGRRLNGKIDLSPYNGVDAMVVAELTVDRKGIYAVDCLHNELVLLKR